MKSVRDISHVMPLLPKQKTSLKWECRPREGCTSTISYPVNQMQTHPSHPQLNGKTVYPGSQISRLIFHPGHRPHWELRCHWPTTDDSGYFCIFIFMFLHTFERSRLNMLLFSDFSSAGEISPVCGQQFGGLEQSLLSNMLSKVTYCHTPIHF